MTRGSSVLSTVLVLISRFLGLQLKLTWCVSPGSVIASDVWNSVSILLRPKFDEILVYEIRSLHLSLANYAIRGRELHFMSLQTLSKQHEKSQISFVRIIFICVFPAPSLVNVYTQTPWSCCICYCLATPDRCQVKPSTSPDIQSFDWSPEFSPSILLAVPDPSIPYLTGLSQSISWQEGPNHSLCCPHFLIHLPT